MAGAVLIDISPKTVIYMYYILNLILSTVKSQL